MKSDTKKWEEDCIKSRSLDCPWCGYDRPDHLCRNCRSEMSKEDCWKYQGYCSEKCLKYITGFLPQHRKEKEKLGIECKCDEPLCAKCLSINCKDKNCPTHTKEEKMKWRKRWEIGNNKKFPHPENY